jgi:cobalt-precorrin-5B (C1)-methyltransferase
VASAAGLTHIAGSTGSTSEDAARAFHNLPLEAMIDMGDFAGGLLKYLRDHQVPRLTIAGGFAKMVKLAQGAMDLHSGRSQVDFAWLAEHVPSQLKPNVLSANTAQQVFELCRHESVDIAQVVAQAALTTAISVLRGALTAVDIVIVDRKGQIIAHAA